MRTNLLIILIILLYSCGRKSINENNSTGSVLKIDLLSEPGSTVKRLTEFASNVEYTPLQTIESSLMGGIRGKIINKEKRIYIQSGEEILSFDMDGKYLFKLQNRGRGPEEYTYLDDFDVSSDNKILTILSSITHKLLVYEISETGFTFQRSVTLKDPAPYKINMIPESDNVFLAIPPWRGTEPTLSLMINTAGDTIHFKPNCYKYKNVRKTGSRANNEMLVYSVGDKACFKEEFSDTVYSVGAMENSFSPRMIFDTHGTLSTPGMKGGSETAGDRTIYVANIFETSRYVFYYYGTKDARNRILFDKKTNNKYKLDTESELKDDLSGGPDFNIEFLNNYCSGDKLFSFLDAITLKKYVAGEDFINAKVSDPKKKEELKKLADSLNETDNPVLVVVTPKNNDAD
jgi:hypothetical protein